MSLAVPHRTRPTALVALLGAALLAAACTSPTTGPDAPPRVGRPELGYRGLRTTPDTTVAGPDASTNTTASDSASRTVVSPWY